MPVMVRFIAAPLRLRSIGPQMARLMIESPCGVKWQQTDAWGWDGIRLGAGAARYRALRVRLMRSTEMRTRHLMLFLGLLGIVAPIAWFYVVYGAYGVNV